MKTTLRSAALLLTLACGLLVAASAYADPLDIGYAGQHEDQVTMDMIQQQAPLVSAKVRNERRNKGFEDMYRQSQAEVLNLKQQLAGQIKLRNVLRDELAKVDPTNRLMDKATRNGIVDEGQAEEYALQKNGKSSL